MEDTVTAKQFMEALNRAMQPIADFVQQVWNNISNAVQTVAKALQRAGLLSRTKRIRRPKQRSRLRARVALKRKGLYHASVWA